MGGDGGELVLLSLIPRFSTIIKMHGVEKLVIYAMAEMNHKCYIQFQIDK